MLLNLRAITIIIYLFKSLVWEACLSLFRHNRFSHFPVCVSEKWKAILIDSNRREFSNERNGYTNVR